MNLDDPHSRAALRMGWTLLAIFMLGGLALEFLHLIKAPWYLEVRIRRELWVLAHAHGALMALLCLAFALTAHHCLPDERRRGRARRTLCWGAPLLPAGFFFGGIGNSESDPSLFIVATPVGALLMLHAVTSTTLGAWRRSSSPQQKTPLPEAAGPVKQNRRKN